MRTPGRLARRKLLEVPTACDAQVEEHDTCFGWDEFSPEELRHFLHDLAGLDVGIEDADEFA